MLPSQFRISITRLHQVISRQASKNLNRLHQASKDLNRSDWTPLWILTLKQALIDTSRDCGSGVY